MSAFLLVLLLGPTIASQTPPATQATPAAPAKKTEFRHDFRGARLDTQTLELQGPSDHVKLEAGGLRVTLPAMSPSGISLNTRFSMQGDFEVTLAFDLVKLEKPAKEAGDGAYLHLAFEAGPKDDGYIGRKRNVDGGNSYIAGLGKAGKSDWVITNTQANSGKMRLTRTGSTLHYLVADGDSDQFRSVREAEVGAGVVRAVQIVLNNKESSAPAEIVLKELMVRADKLSGPGAEAAAAPPPPSGPGVLTIQDEHIAGEPRAIEEGKLVIGSDPPRRVPLDEIARITLAGAAPLTAQWMGQDNHDLVQVGSAAGGNGIQDMHVALNGLASDRKIKQIVAVCMHPTRQGIWRLDPTGTPNWRIAIERAERSDAADLYLEPNQDNSGQTFTITVTYEDGTTAQVSVPVTTHTDPQLKTTKSDNAPGAENETGPPRVVVSLEAGDRLQGELLALTKDALKLHVPWQNELDVPLVQVLGIEFGSTPSLDARNRYAAELRRRGGEDTAVVLGKDGAVVLVSGSVEGLAEGKLRFSYQGEVRSINQPRLVGLIFAAHPPVRDPRAPYQVFGFVSGDKLSGSWEGIDQDGFSIKTAWGTAVRLPRGLLSDVAFRNGKMVYLSDMEPATVDEVPYFGRLLSYHRDQNLQGEPLRMKGKTYAKGIAVHSRCVLTYAIDGRFEQFRGVVGFDETAGNRGRVVCRVLGDGKELLAESDLRADADPKPFELGVAGVRQLTLEVDFGEAEDTGDRVIWADPRLFRASSQATAAGG